jgi:hypothetical protein
MNWATFWAMLLRNSSGHADVELKIIQKDTGTQYVHIPEQETVCNKYVLATY